MTGVGTSGIVPLLPAFESVEDVVLNSYTLGVDVTSLFQAENIFEVFKAVWCSFLDAF